MQNQRAILFLALAVLMGLGAVFAARHWLESQAPVAEADTGVTQVVVARVDVPIGSGLNARQLDTVSWPRAYVPKGSFSKTAPLENRVVRRPLAAGEPILAPFLLPEGALAGLGSVLPQKMRAVSVKVDPVIGVAGFVTPGSRVDVLVTLRRIDQPKSLPYSKVVLQDVPVLAIDQRVEEAENGEPELVSVVTVEVSSEQAEKLIYSAHEGRLQLALRNPGDHEVVSTGAISVAHLLGSPKKVARKGKKPGVGVQVIRGSAVSVQAF
ncbi:MAG: Flp pilus assembly protein CpaB [Myxococcota bacterium]